MQRVAGEWQVGQHCINTILTAVMQYNWVTRAADILPFMSLMLGSWNNNHSITCNNDSRHTFVLMSVYNFL